MGFLNKKPIIRQEGFHPLELNEDNVRAIFERCLAKPDSKNFLTLLFSQQPMVMNWALKNKYNSIL